MFTFLTAFDPTDLPGGSLDPLGFERGYLHLADMILPGMTNVADQPRYFSILCAGVLLAETASARTQQEIRKRRLDAIMRLERLWALGNVLSIEDGSAESLSGLRGVTYAKRYRESLFEKSKDRTSTNFTLLVRQMPYGAIGMYGSVAEGCGLIDKRQYDLLGLGHDLGESFISDIPKAIKNAVKNDEEVKLDNLGEWGSKTSLKTDSSQTEKKVIGEMIDRNPIRSRFMETVKMVPAKENEEELERLKRIATKLQDHSDDKDLLEAVNEIIAYEECYRLSLLAFERLLFLCRDHVDGMGKYSMSELSSDAVLASVKNQFVPALGKLLIHLERDSRRNKDTIFQDVLSFLKKAGDASGDIHEFTNVILQRHTEIQHGKIDRGIRKLPWIQATNGSLHLTTTSAVGLRKEAKSIDDIAAHPYRLRAADNWLTGAGRYENK